MKQIWSKRFPALILCAVLLFTLCGCQKTNPLSENFPLDNKSIGSLEAMYGKTLEEAGKEWDFSLDELTEIPAGSGAWSLDRTITIEGKEFTPTLMMSPDMFCGFAYSYQGESAEETAELAEAIYAKLLEEYGTPAYKASSGPNLLGREGVFDEMRSASAGELHSWYEVWGVIGKISWFRMDVDIWEAQELFSIRLTYRVLPEEWHRFEPGYTAPYSLSPSFHSEE